MNRRLALPENSDKHAEVEFERDGEAVRVMAAGAAATRGLRGRYDASGMAAALLVDRAREPR